MTPSEQSLHSLSSDNDCNILQSETTPCNYKLSDDELSIKIVELVEYYLSDENVLKDQFLLKHIRRNKEGYVSIKLMTSYRKLKSLTKDWQFVADSLKLSTKLIVNSEGNRVCRKIAVPEYESLSLSRTVIAYNFPFDKPNVDKVSSLFNTCGEMFLIQILRPGFSVPTDVRKLFSKNPEIPREMCALIEFEDQSAVRKAMDVKEAKVLPLADISSGNSKRKYKKNAAKKHAASENDSASRDKNSRSSSVSSGYLSSSPKCSYWELKRASSALQQIAPSVADNRNYRENGKCRQKLSGFIIRLPKGPDGTKGFRDLRGACLSPTQQ